MIKRAKASHHFAASHAQELCRTMNQIRFVSPEDEPGFHEDWKTLLRAAFEKADWIDVVNRLSGYSGAQTWSIRTQTGPTSQFFVVKFDQPKFLDREYRKATNDVTGGALFGNPVTPEGGIVSLPGIPWALMKSTLKGTAKSDTLLTLLRLEGAAHIERILRSVFTRDDRLRANIQPVLVSYGSYYDRLLPEHFRFEGLDGMDRNAYEIEATQLARDLANIEKAILPTRRNVHLQNFYLEKVKPEVWTLRPDHPVEDRPPRLRVKYRPTPGQQPPSAADQPIPSLFGQNPKSRLDLLREYTAEALSGARVTQKTISFRKIRYPNPLYFLHELLRKQDELNMALIHGDLNLRNILVALYKDERGATPEVKDWLIDFADTAIGPVLLDFQWLEVQVILWLVAPAIHKAQLNINVLIDLFLALHECEIDRTAFVPPPLQTAYTVLRQIRRLAKEYLVDDWSEYYHGLVLALLGALRLKESVTDLDSFAPRVLFLSAAIVLAWAEVVPSDDLKHVSAVLQPPPKFSIPESPPLPVPPPPQKTPPAPPLPLPKKAARWAGIRSLWPALIAVLVIAGGLFGNPGLTDRLGMENFFENLRSSIPAAIDKFSPDPTPPPQPPTPTPLLSYNGTKEEACAKMQQDGQLTVAASKDSGPYSYEDAGGEMKGLEIEILTDVVRRCFGLSPEEDPVQLTKLVIIPISVGERQSTIENPEVPALVVVGNVAYLRERCDPGGGLICTKPYAVDRYALAVHKAGSITEYCDPDVTTILVLEGTTGKMTIDEYKQTCGFEGTIMIDPRANRTSALQAVAASPGVPVAYRSNHDLIRFRLNQLDNALEDVQILDGTTEEDIVMWLRGDKIGLRNYIDETLAEMTQTSRLQQLCEEYLAPVGKNCTGNPPFRPAPPTPTPAGAPVE
jgi:hypothetical protein